MSHRVIVESQSEESKGLRPSNSTSTGRGGEGGRRGPFADVDVYATDPVAGALVGISADEVVIRRHDPRAGVVHVHFPRFGFQIKAQA